MARASALIRATTQTRQKEKREYITNASITKLILKDLVNQTWEKFPKNIITNLRYGYSYIYCKYSFNFKHEINLAQGRITFSHLRWVVKNA